MARIRIAAAVLAAAILPVVTAVAQERPTERDASLRVTPVGYVQFDVRAFPGWGDSQDDDDLHRKAAEIRRLRRLYADGLTELDGRAGGSFADAPV